MSADAAASCAVAGRWAKPSLLRFVAETRSALPLEVVAAAATIALAAVMPDVPDRIGTPAAVS
ncbi:hypothetical protein Ato02nite_005510 [Paractinoplanes toevensis]|uniref:Uncharacterized protein n=1 Tax=Paractinoplanes toevensis TaxID=571911 RepID=A0A919W354_9ACTN|nr:hypothetical protein Ato02nite_005510 [Actinoplanes toevensis]